MRLASDIKMINFYSYFLFSSYLYGLTLAICESQLFGDPVHGVVMPLFLLLFFAKTRDPESFAYLSCKFIGDFGVAWHRLHGTIRRVHPKRMRSAFSFEVATMPTQIPQ
jgi:hypothetical protein